MKCPKKKNKKYATGGFVTPEEQLAWLQANHPDQVAAYQGLKTGQEKQDFYTELNQPTALSETKKAEIAARYVKPTGDPEQVQSQANSVETSNAIGTGLTTAKAGLSTAQSLGLVGSGAGAATGLGGAGVAGFGGAGAAGLGGVGAAGAPVAAGLGGTTTAGTVAGLGGASGAGATGTGVAAVATPLAWIAGSYILGSAAGNALKKKDDWGVNKSTLSESVGSTLHPQDDWLAKDGFFDNLGKGKVIDAAISTVPFAAGAYRNEKRKKHRRVTEDEFYYNKRKQAEALEGAQTGSSIANYGMAEGGIIKGKGTGKSDSIKSKNIPNGSFVVPVENAPMAMMLRNAVLGKSNKKASLKGGGEVNVSNGEHLFTPQEVLKLQSAGIDLNALAPNAKGGNKLSTGGPPQTKSKKATKEEIAASKKMYIQMIIDEAHKQGISDPKVIKNIITIAWHETSGFNPDSLKTEFKSDKNKNYNKGKLYQGNGVSQITNPKNYEWATKYFKDQGLDYDLVKNPELAQRPEIGVPILVAGLKQGQFSSTGTKIEDVKDETPAEIYKKTYNGGAIKSMTDNVEYVAKLLAGYDLPAPNATELTGIGTNDYYMKDYVGDGTPKIGNFKTKQKAGAAPVAVVPPVSAPIKKVPVPATKKSNTTKDLNDPKNVEISKLMHEANVQTKAQYEKYLELKKQVEDSGIKLKGSDPLTGTALRDPNQRITEKQQKLLDQYNEERAKYSKMYDSRETITEIASNNNQATQGDASGRNAGSMRGTTRQDDLNFVRATFGNNFTGDQAEITKTDPSYTVNGTPGDLSNKIQYIKPSLLTAYNGVVPLSKFKVQGPAVAKGAFVGPPSPEVENRPVALIPTPAKKDVPLTPEQILANNQVGPRMADGTFATKGYTPPPSEKINIMEALGGANGLVALSQAGLGLAGTLSEKRPVGHVSEELWSGKAEAVKAQRLAEEEARFGFDPAARSQLDNQISSNRAADYSEIDAGTGNTSAGYGLKRLSSFNTGKNLVDVAVQNEAIKAEKKRYANSLRVPIDAFRRDIANEQRGLFQDKLQGFKERQSASGALLNAGITNYLEGVNSANYNAELKRLREKYPNG